MKKEASNIKMNQFHRHHIFSVQYAFYFWLKKPNIKIKPANQLLCEWTALNAERIGNKIYMYVSFN